MDRRQSKKIAFRVSREKLMMKTRSKYWPLFIILILLTACASYGYYIYSQRTSQDKVVLKNISDRTGLQPNWLAVREYIYCDLLKPGTSREQVEKGLALVGEYWSPNDKGTPIGGSFEEQISFTDPSTYYNLSPLMVTYDENWKVISAGAGEFNHGPRASCEIMGDKGKTQSTP
jgi:hypothetical protein